jgi:hypothetical protein
MRLHIDHLHFAAKIFVVEKRLHYVQRVATNQLVLSICAGVTLDQQISRLCHRVRCAAAVS